MVIQHLNSIQRGIPHQKGKEEGNSDEEEVKEMGKEENKEEKEGGGRRGERRRRRRTRPDQYTRLEFSRRSWGLVHKLATCAFK